MRCRTKLGRFKKGCRRSLSGLGNPGKRTAKGRCLKWSKGRSRCMKRASRRR